MDWSGSKLGACSLFDYVPTEKHKNNVQLSSYDGPFKKRYLSGPKECPNVEEKCQVYKNILGN